MSLNSVNTNFGATVALESLNTTNAQLQAVQKQVSTGYRVADATDDGAAYAVAQRVRSDVSALTSANQQLGNAQGLLSTTLSGLNNISNTLASARDVLVKLADSNVTGSQRNQYITQYDSLVNNIKSYINDASYNGKTLIGSFAAASGGIASFGGINVVRNEAGSTISVSTFDGSAFYTSIAFTDTDLGVSTTVAGFITATATPGTFINQLDAIGTQLNDYGAVNSYIRNQISYNNDKIDSLNTGIGALVDADLAKESAQLQALQIRQQLGTQALSIANQSPQSLLSLFK